MKILKRIVWLLFLAIAVPFFLLGLIPMGDGSNALSDALSFQIFSSTPTMGTDFLDDYWITVAYTILVWGAIAYFGYKFYKRLRPDPKHSSQNL